MNNEAAREWYRIITSTSASLAPNGWVEEDDPVYLLPEGYEVGPPAIDFDPLLAEALTAAREAPGADPWSASSARRRETDFADPIPEEAKRAWGSAAREAPGADPTVAALEADFEPGGLIF